MKPFFTIFFIVVTTVITAQVNIIAGSYSADLTEATTGNHTHWDLELTKQGTFEYHCLRKLAGQAEENSYGRGTWSSKKLVITFRTRETDLNTTYTENLDNAKAISSWISPFRKSETDEKEHIQFFTSKGDLKDIKLYKN